MCEESLTHDVRKKFVTEGVSMQWNILPRDAVDSPCLEGDLRPKLVGL